MAIIHALSWICGAGLALLAAGAWLAPRLGADAAACIGLLAVAAALLASEPGRAHRASRRTTAACLLCAALGFAGYPLWVGAVASLGTALGLPPAGAFTPADASAPLWIASLLLAPLCEEILYRDRLLPALERRAGPVAAIVGSSALFAGPHLAPWPMLAAFCTGLVLGALRRLSGALAPCIGLHAGLNLGVLSLGAPPLRALAVAATLALTGAADVRAAELAFDGTLSFRFLSPALPALRVTGAGVATVNGSSGAPHLSALDLSGGISGRATAPVTDPDLVGSAVLGVVADVALGTGALRTSASSPTGLGGAVPVGGVLGVCLFDPSCLPGGFVALPLSQPQRSAALGVGGLLTAGGAGAIRISVLAAPWTSGTAVLTATTPSGSVVTLASAGSAHGPFSFTTSTALSGGQISLVTPVRVISEGPAAFDLFGRLSVRFIPEPGVGLLLATGVIALVLVGRHRARP